MTQPPSSLTDPDVLFSALEAELAARTPEPLEFPSFRQAAVLVPILRAPDGLHLLLTVRSSKLSNHAGQIAFPGGRLDPGETVLEAALRETVEETGVDVSGVRFLGELRTVPSPARYRVTPVVGVLPWPQPVALNPAEVAEAFTVPLSELLTLTPREEARVLEGQRRTIYYYTHRSAERERLIWGLTGNIVADLLGAVRPLWGTIR